MKNKKMIFGIVVIATVFAFLTVSCSGGGGGKTLNSPEALKEYLDKQPANSPDKPIKVSMTINNPMLESVGKVISEAGKYVSLNITGNALTTISFGNDNLVGITLPNSVTKIEYIGLGNPNSITIPAGVTEIGSISGVSAINVNAANANFSSQDGVLFNKDKTTLLQYPYKKTEETYTIPNSVTSIGKYAFSGCKSLTSVTIGNSVTSIGESAFSGSKLTSITIPNSVTSIGKNAFYRCDSLASVTIGNNVTSIGENAFSYCESLTSVTIGNSVTSIGENAFSYCESLTSVTFEGNIPKKGVAREFGGTVTYWEVGYGYKGGGYIGDLYEKYIAGGMGKYTRPNGHSEIWTKQ